MNLLSFVPVCLISSLCVLQFTSGASRRTFRTRATTERLHSETITQPLSEEGFESTLSNLEANAKKIDENFPQQQTTHAPQQVHDGQGMMSVLSGVNEGQHEGQQAVHVGKRSAEKVLYRVVRQDDEGAESGAQEAPPEGGEQPGGEAGQPPPQEGAGEQMTPPQDTPPIEQQTPPEMQPGQEQNHDQTKPHYPDQHHPDQHSSEMPRPGGEGGDYGGEDGRHTTVHHGGGMHTMPGGRQPGKGVTMRGGKYGGKSTPYRAGQNKNSKNNGRSRGTGWNRESVLGSKD